MKYIYIETYGCSANQNNSEILAGLLRSGGYQITNNIEISEIVIINSCIVKGKTENKIKRKIQDLIKDFPSKLLIITGCMPETDSKEIQKIASNSIQLGTHHFKDIINLIKDHTNNQLTSQKQIDYLSEQNEEKIFLPKIPKNKLISITQISEGCLGDCTYCKTKLAKGKLFSYPSEKIIKSIESDLQNGAKEVWLTSQDCAAYGLDKNKTSQLPNLLHQILSLKHNFKLRLGMSNPNHIYPILNELIEIYKNKKIYKFLHIPIQSASNKILTQMNRKYNIYQAEEIINKFKQEFSDITMATDIITGYPTESEQDHNQNIDLINKYKPDVFNLSKFSSHKGTEASKLKPLSIGIINKRASELMKLHRDGAIENKNKFLGKNTKVFVNSKSEMPGFLEARDNNYNIVFVKGGLELFGKNIEVKINKVGVHHMFGEIIPKL